MKIGLVHNWPGAKNSEFDIIVRIRDILTRWEINSEMIDPIGHILDANTNRTDKLVDDLDLVLNLHYTNPKYLSALSYVVNWNPLAYIIDDPNTQLPIPIKQLNYYVHCIRSHDRVLSASSDLVDAYAHSARINLVTKPIEDKQLHLHTTIAKQGYIPVNEITDKELKVFYIGVNWEKVSKKEETKERHQGLFEILDQSQQFKFYGIKKLYGVELWEGINSYCGELPFDGGQSIIDKSVECGISLVLSSEQHKKSELVSTRIFQACKAGAIIISDPNPFIEKHFSDSVYYFDDQGTPNDIANSILQQVTLIKKNPQEAFKRAKKAQSIFLQHFALEDELHKICEQSKRDLKAIESNQLKISHKVVSIVFYVRTFDESIYQQFIDNINKQIHQNIKIYIVILKSHKEKFISCLQGNPLNDSIELEYSLLTNELPLGHVISNINLKASDYLLIYSVGFKWYVDHILELLSKAQATDADIVNSPLFMEYSAQKQNLDLMEFFIKGSENQQNPMLISHLKKLDFTSYALGNMLISSGVLLKFQSLKDKTLLTQFDLMSPFIMLLLVNEQKKLVFSMTEYASSLLPIDNSNYATWDYDEYQFTFENAWLNKQRDRNALCAFMPYMPDLICPLDLEILLLNWTDEQDKKQTDINQSITKKITKLLIKSNIMLQASESKQSTNLLISLKHKVKRKLRNFPVCMTLVKYLYGYLRITYRFLRQ